MKMASRSIDLISKKNKSLHVQHTFFLISKKKKQICTCSTLFFLISKKKPNLYVQHAFLSSFAVILHDYNAVLYQQDVKRPSYTLFLWRNCRMCLPKILFPVFMLAFIFSLSLFFTWPLTFLIFSPLLYRRYEIFMFFFQPNSCSLALSLLSMQV